MIQINKIELKYINSNVESYVDSRCMFFDNKIPIFFIKTSMSQAYFSIFMNPRNNQNLNYKYLYFKRANITETDTEMINFIRYKQIDD